jgi:hypothetical protein
MDDSILAVPDEEECNAHIKAARLHITEEGELEDFIETNID